MRVLSLLIAGSVTIALLVPVGDASAVSPSQKFRNCAALAKDYPTGVARNVRAANAALRTGFERPTVRRKIYQANMRLDRDKRGAVCLVAVQPPTEVTDFQARPGTPSLGGSPQIYVT